MTHHMLSTRIPLMAEIVPAGTEQFIIFVVFRIIEKQTRKLTTNPLRDRDTSMVNQ